MRVGLPLSASLVWPLVGLAGSSRSRVLAPALRRRLHSPLIPGRWSLAFPAVLFDLATF